MAKKKRKRSPPKKSAPQKIPPKPPAKAKAMPVKAKKRKGKPRGVPPSPTKIPGAATSRFTKDVVEPVNVPMPVPLDTKTGGTGQVTGKRLVKITGDMPFTPGYDQQKVINVPTPLAKDSGEFLPYL